jgi:hypothetical protein
MPDRTTRSTVISDSCLPDIASLDCARGLHPISYEYVARVSREKGNRDLREKVYELHSKYGLAAAPLRVRDGRLLCGPGSSR